MIRPVAEYWPEFAQKGKENITLAHMLSHQSGLFDIRNIIDDATEMADWSHMLDRIAAAEPRFQSCYRCRLSTADFWLAGGWSIRKSNW